MNYTKVLVTDRLPNETKQYITDKGYLKFDLTTKSFYDERNFYKPTFWLEEIKSFEQSSEVVMEYLANNHHPHHTVIITSTNSELLEGKKSTGQTLKFIKD